MPRLLITSYLVAIVFFGWGYAMTQFKIFPWTYIQPIEKDIRAFIQGGDGEKTNLVEKIENDLDLRPSRQIFSYHSNSGRNYVPLVIKGLKFRRQQPRIFSTDKQLKGYRLIFGSFDFMDSLHAGILLDENNEVVHRWIVDQEVLSQQISKYNNDHDDKLKYQSAGKRVPQGLEVLEDGSLIINEGLRGNGMHKLDFCGNFLWSAYGRYHHAVMLDRNKRALWAFKDPDIVQVNLDTGAIIRTISWRDIHLANPSVSILTPRRKISKSEWMQDPFHENDIEPLPAELVAAFPMFEMGDLLISHRSLNLVFVIDPDDLRIKWWRSGMVRRAHDPDWQASGNITIFDNNRRDGENLETKELPIDNHIRYSQIISIDPKTYHSEIIYDGKLDSFYSEQRGVHQLLPNGNILITSSHQGRILEVTPQGDTVFEFLNTFDEDKVLILSEARWFAPDYFDFDITDKSFCLQ